MISYLKNVLLIMGEYKKYLPLVLLLSFLAMGLELLGLSLIIPFLTVLKNPELMYAQPLWQSTAGALGVDNGRSALIFISAVVFVVYTVKTVLNILVQRSILNFSYDLQAYLRTKFAGFYLSAPYLFHTKRRSNEIITILQSHVNVFSKGIVGSLLQITAEGITLIAVLTFLVISFPAPSITAFVTLGLFAFVYDRLVRRQLKVAGQELIDTSNDQLKAVHHGVKSLKEARVLGHCEYFYDDLAEVSVRASKVNGYIAVLQMVPRYILELIIVGIVILSSIMMLLTGNSGVDVLDSLAVFSVAAIRLLPSATRIVSNISNLRYGNKHLEELLADFRELQGGELQVNASQPKRADYLSVDIRNIHFTYPDTSQKILDGADIAFKKGEIIGICGPSGSGKSTLVDVILGLLTPDKAEFYLNDSVVSKEDWAQHNLASYIPQKPIMLDDTLRRNVALGVRDEDISDNKVIEALEKAQLSEVLQGMALGLDTVIGEDGILFSGGQRQRIALARSFYFGRDIIVFDEATSALDKETEIEILRAIQGLRGEATILFISHNDQPLQICDRICYLENGKLMEKKK